jgi:hypothetical protein
MNETVYYRAFEPDLYSPKWTRSALSNALWLNCGRTIVSVQNKLAAYKRSEKRSGIDG